MLILCWEYSFELNFKKMAGNLKKTVMFFRFPAVFLKKKKAKSEGIEGEFIIFVFVLKENIDRCIGNE